MLTFFLPLFKRVWSCLVVCCLSLPVLAQYVTVSPYFPTATKEITIIFDLKQSKDSRATGLLGKSSDLYAWIWGGSDVNNKKAEFGPTGQGSFNQPYEPSKLTPLGNDRWSIKLTPNQYLAISGGKTLAWMGVLAKNGNGSSQTEDFLFTIYDSKLYVAFANPTEKLFYVEAGTNVSIKALASQPCTMTLSVNGANRSPILNTDSLADVVGAGGVANVRRTIKITAQTTTETATEEFTFIVNPIPAISPLPANLKDGINYQSATKATLVLYAPGKSFVYALGDFNNWQQTNASLMNRTPDGKRFWIELSNLEPSKEYAFEYLVDGKIAVADPYAEKLLDRNNDSFISGTTYPNLKAFPSQAQGNMVSVLQTNPPVYTWKTTNFKRPQSQDLVVYELLVRDFIGTQNYRTLADTLPYLKNLGVNCIELMPVMEFTGNDSWGYNPVFYFAPDKAYGTANDFKAFIDKCHQNGIAVVLDMVLNHADYEFPYVKMYWDSSQPSKDNPMFNQQATHPFSVFFDFNHESQATKDFVQRVCQYWLQEYRIDGYRFDLSKGFTQTNSGTNVGLWSSYDASRVAIWKRIYDQIRVVDPSAYVMLEHFADDREEQELANYGMMLWGNLNGEFRNAIKGQNSTINRLSYAERGFQKPAVIGYMESHDEERLLWDAVNNGTANALYSTRTLSNALERIKASAAFLFGTPGPKLLWQFGEIGYDISIDQNGRTGKKPLKWDYLQVPERQKLYKVFAELIKLKTTQQAFRSSSFTLNGSSKLKQLNITDASMNVCIVGNFDIQEYSTSVRFASTGKWYDYFTNQEVNISELDMPMTLQPGEFHIFTTVKLPKPESGLVPWAAFPTVTSVTEPLEEHISIAPNPAGNRIRVEIKSGYRGEVELLLRDATGHSYNHWKPYKDTETLVQELPIQPLNGGLYLLEIQQGGHLTVKKVAKL
ncbi:MAG: alpha-amylase family glycosyl hydrolase [Spirosomataceae bacterium]